MDSISFDVYFAMTLCVCSSCEIVAVFRQTSFDAFCSAMTLCDEVAMRSCDEFVVELVVVSIL